MRRLRHLIISLIVITLFVMTACKGSPQQTTTQTAEPQPPTSEPADNTGDDSSGPIATEENDADREESQPIVRSTSPGVVVMDANIHNPVGVSWSPDGTRIAIALEHAVNIYDSATYELLLTIEAENITSPDVLWSPDAQTIAFGLSTGNIAFHDSLTGDERFTLPGTGTFTLAMAWSPDGRWFAAGRDNERVKLYDLQSGALPVNLSIGNHELAFSPDGTRLAGMYFGAWQAEMVDVNTHALISAYEVGAYGDTIALSPDASRIMVSFDTGETGIALFDTATGERLDTMPIMQAQSMVWSPDGRFVIGTKGYGARARQDAVLMTADLSAAATLASLDSPPIEAAWSPDSTRLLTLHEKKAHIVTLAEMEEASPILQAAATLSVIAPRGVSAAISLVEPQAPAPPTPLAAESPSLFRGSVPYGTLTQLGMGDMNTVAASPNGSWLAVGGRTGVSVYKADTLEIAWTSRIGGVSMMRWAPDSLAVAIGKTDGEIYVLDAFRGQQLYHMEAHSSTITSLEWAPSSDRVISTESNGVGLIWDFTNDDPPPALIRNDADLEEQAANWGSSFDDAQGRISPDGTRFLTFYEIGAGCTETARFSPRRGSNSGKRELFCGCGGGPDSAVAIWDAVTGLQYQLFKPYPILSAAWLDNQRIITLGAEGMIDIFDASTGESTFNVNLAQSDSWRWFTNMSVDPTGTLLALDDAYGSGLILDLATGEVLYDIPDTEASIRWLPDGQSFMTTSLEKFYTAIHRASDGVEIARVSDIVGQGTLSADGSILYAWSGADGQTLSAYNLATNERRSVLTDTTSLFSATWSPDGSYVAAGIASDRDLEYEVMVWDIRTGEIVRTYNMELPDEWGFNQVTVAWSPDGTMLAAGASETVVWDVASGEELTRFDHMTFALKWSPDSTRLAVGSEKYVYVIDPRTGDNQLTFQEHKTNQSNYAPMIPALDWSADGQFIASGGSDGQAMVWNAATGEVVMSFTLPEGDESWLGVAVVSFSPLGRSLAVGRAYDSKFIIDDENTGIGHWEQVVPDAYVVDIASAQIIYYMGSVYSGVGGLEWSPDGTTIAMSFGDPGFIFGMNWYETGSTAIMIWSASNGEWMYTMEGHSTEVHSLEFSASGERLLSASMDGTVLVWDMRPRLDEE